ncbi:hypothetical protein SAMN02799624_04687 [Paenibacillus sp. UNC496MF]|uniref:hypothetical protein n=1 Tax=Paenibacillus sp. UNC496MF TaxID=1502753 RepID=UPI0008EC8D2E|nr:hypothetical protein [Paenibacillus sp. UNC496MF]SFJ48710.1 hypothetical protein SAMN02799624_04687 [Paenibacillus sp. UNC496MF]
MKLDIAAIVEQLGLDSARFGEWKSKALETEQACIIQARSFEGIENECALHPINGNPLCTDAPNSP